MLSTVPLMVCGGMLMAVPLVLGWLYCLEAMCVIFSDDYCYEHVGNTEDSEICIKWKPLQGELCSTHGNDE